MPGLLHYFLFMPDMSEKKSPPQKEKPVLLRTPQSEGKAIKRKLLTPDPLEDEDKKVTSKRKRPIGFDASSPDPGNSSSPRGGSGNVRNLGVPLSERQQMALLMRMTDESSQGDTSPKPSSPPPSVTSTKRTPADKKVNKRNERGETALHLAAKRGDVKQAKKLIKAGASVNVTDYAGWTPLHEACNLGNVDVAKQLLKAGANVNVLGLGDESPLHDAAINNHSKLVTILLKHGANPLQANVKGETPVDVANDINIKKLLNHEIISSNSESSSVDEIRSPTSPESLASIKDEDGGIDVEEIKPRSSSMSVVRGDNSYPPVSLAGNRRMSLPPKSSVDKPLPSPRLFLKFKSAGSNSSEETGSNQGLSRRKSTDSKEPMFKSYILTMDTGDQQQQQQQLQSHGHHGDRVLGGGSTRSTPPCSPVSSMEVDAVEPRRDNPASVGDLHPHNQQHKQDSWESIMGVGGGQNSVGAVAGPTSSFPALPSLKLQCVRPDSSEGEMGYPSSHGASLQRLRTEPFTPQPVEEVSDDDDERSDGVFKTSVGNCRIQNSQLSPSATTGLNARLGGDGQHIPAVDGVNHYTSGSGSAKHQSAAIVSGASPMDVSSQCVSTTGSASASFPSVQKDALISSSTAMERTSQLLNPHSGGRGSGGGSGNGSCSISCVNSAGVSSVNSGSSLTVTVSSVSASHQTNLSASVSASSSGTSLTSTSQPLRWEMRSRTERGDRASPKALPVVDLFSTEKSDSSASSPLPMDLEEKASSWPRSDHDNENGPPCPKVPPLKIILPSQKTSTTPHAPDHTNNPLSKPALPYVLNPTQPTTGSGSAGEWVMEVTDCDENGRPPVSSSSTAVMQEENLLQVSTHSPARLSRPSSRAESNVGEEHRNSSTKTNVESSPVGKDDASGSGREEEDGNGEKQGEGGDKEEDARPTRTLRSHTAMKQQQDQKHQKPGSTKSDTGKDSQEKGSKADPKEFSDSKEDGETASETGGMQHEDIPVHPRKRKLRAKTEAQTREQAENREVILEKPPNPYELYLNLRRQQIQNRYKLMNSVTPKPPTGYKDYLMVNCTYVLQGNATSTLSVPMLTPPNSVTGAMRDLFLEQEKARYQLRLQHHIEREKLMLAIEQEILREHARAARAVANQNQPLSVCTILCEEEIYNLQELDQMDDRDKSSRSRYNGRQFLSWLQDVGDKYNNIKNLLLLRHHHEAESLHAVQKMDWEWKLKECGQCDYKTAPVIDEVHLPMVQVNDEFELLPPQRLRPS